jgi:hypothetical protein
MSWFPLNGLPPAAVQGAGLPAPQAVLRYSTATTATIVAAGALLTLALVAPPVGVPLLFTALAIVAVVNMGRGGLWGGGSFFHGYYSRPWYQPSYFYSQPTPWYRPSAPSSWGWSGHSHSQPAMRMPFQSDGVRGHSQRARVIPGLF